MCWRKGSGWPKTSEESVERVSKKILKIPKIATKNKSGNTYSANNSLTHPEQTLDNETLQATTRSSHNGRGQLKAQTEFTCSMSQAERILNICEIGYEIFFEKFSEFFIPIWRNNSYIVHY